MATDDHPSFEQHFAQFLLRWQWLVLVVFVSASVLKEISEGHLFDAESLSDITLYGLIVPGVVWCLLIVVAREVFRRTRRGEALQIRSQLVHDLALYHQFDQLAQYAVAFPATILPVNHASLFIYDHLYARLEFAQEWNIVAGLNSPVPRYLKETTVCQACLHSKSPVSRHTAVCAFELGIQLDPAMNEYCLPLKYDQVLVGMLRLRCRSGQHLTHDQLDLLQWIAPEIALALATSIGYARQADLTRTEVQRRERLRLTQELHDSLAARVFYLHLGIDQLSGEASLNGNAVVHEKLERLRSEAAKLYDEIRLKLTMLRASSTPDFATGLRALVDDLAAKGDLRVDVSSEGDAVEPSADTAWALLDLVREGLNNVMRHAQATQAHIKLTWAPDCATIRLCDDGQGFDPEAAPQAGHYGLTLMREMVDSLRGELNISSAPGQGTCLQFRLPLHPPHGQPGAELATEFFHSNIAATQGHLGAK